MAFSYQLSAISYKFPASKGRQFLSLGTLAQPTNQLLFDLILGDEARQARGGGLSGLRPLVRTGP